MHVSVSGFRVFPILIRGSQGSYPADKSLMSKGPVGVSYKKTTMALRNRHGVGYPGR